MSRAEELRRERLSAVVKRNLTSILLEVTDSMFGKLKLLCESCHRIRQACNLKHGSFTSCMLTSCEGRTTISCGKEDGAAQGQVQPILQQWLRVLQRRLRGRLSALVSRSAMIQERPCLRSLPRLRLLRQLSS